MVVSSTSRCTIQGGALRENRMNGLCARDEGRSLVVGCEIAGIEMVGANVSGAAQVTLRDGAISGGTDKGLSLSDKAAVQAERCRISGPRHEAVYVTSGSAVSRHCVLEKNCGMSPVIRLRPMAGVNVSGGEGTAELDDCTLVDNKDAGAAFSSGEKLTARNCTLSNYAGPGAAIWGGQGFFTAVYPRVAHGPCISA